MNLWLGAEGYRLVRSIRLELQGAEGPEDLANFPCRYGSGVAGGSRLDKAQIWAYRRPLQAPTGLTGIIGSGAVPELLVGAPCASRTGRRGQVVAFLW